MAKKWPAIFESEILKNNQNPAGFCEQNKQQNEKTNATHAPTTQPIAGTGQIYRSNFGRPKPKAERQS